MKYNPLPSRLWLTPGVLGIALMLGCSQAMGDRPSEGTREFAGLKNIGSEVLREFVRLKNIGDDRAHELLAETPAKLKGPVSEEEAARLDAIYLLSKKLEILEVKPRPKSQYVLVVRGVFDTEPLQVQSTNGVQRWQRSLFDPDITVEIRDGKIHGVKVGVHSDS